MDRRLTRSLLAATIVTIALGTCRIASAQALEAVPPQTQAIASPPPTTALYGEQTVMADAAALALFVAGAAVPSGQLIGAGLATYALAAPAVHLAHDNPGRAGVSLFLRVAGPFVAGFIGHEIDSAHCGSDNSLCVVGGMVVGTLAGALAASAVDAVLLARTPAQPASADRMSRARSVTPTLAMSREGEVAFGLAGRF